MRVHTLSLLVALILGISFSTPAYGQVSKSCGHNHAQVKQFGSQEAYDQIKAEILKKRAAQPAIAPHQKSNTTLTIPIVFHVIHDGEPVGTGKNIADGQVMAQLNSLNDDFTGSNDNFSDDTRAGWDAVKGSPMISFCLATVDATGAATTGIVRHQIAITGTDASNNNIEDVKASINWDPSKYMNVYVLSIPGTSAQGGVVGWAYLPYFGTVGEDIDGVVVDYNWFGGEGYTQSGNKTLTHETGHYLGLFHTFDGNACDKDDGLADTPNISTATSDLAASLNCGNAMNNYPTGPSTCGNEHMYINYMDYVNDDNCPTAFSGEQVTLMRGVLEGTDPVFYNRTALVANTNVACAGGTICDLFASSSFTALSCNSTSDATATVAASGGTAPYTYEWSTSPAQTTVTATGLGSGTHYVTVTDNGGCSVAVNVVVPDHVPLSLQMQSQPESAPNADDGQASVTASGGSAPYTYAWNNGGTTAAISNLPPTTYMVTVTDANNCTATSSVAVSGFDCQPHGLTSDGGSILCNGGTDVLSITNVNGTAPYTYSWNTGASTSSITVNAAGIYSATVTDAIGCSDSIFITVTEPAAITIDATKQDVTQLGGSDGQITLTVGGGTPGYSYLWSDNVTTANRTGLAAGTYAVTVTDNNNCTATETVTINDVTCGSMVINPITTDVACFGEANGSIDLNIQTIAAPYTVNWSNNMTTDTISDLAIGTYSVTITDADACELLRSFTITEPTALAFDEVTTVDNDCHGEATGSITLSVSGGVMPYVYQWSTGGSAASLQNQAAGTYGVSVTDANNCQITDSYTISEPTALEVNSTIQHVSAVAATDGSISLAISGGVESYTINWNTGASTAALANLAVGTYSYTVTDANGCTSLGDIAIEQYDCPDLSVTVEVTPVSCRGAADGSLMATTSGGTAPYTYQWSNSESGSSIEGLSADNYLVIATDSKGCIGNGSAVIQDPEQLTFETEIMNETGGGSEDGQVTVNIVGGVGPYTVVWSDGGIGEERSELSPGQYEFQIQDSNGCSLTGNATVNAFVCPLIQATVEVVNNECTEGGVDVQVQGGTAPYTYVIDSTTYQTDSIRGLSSGAYEVLVIDANGCTDVVSFSIHSPAELVLEDLITEDAIGILPGSATVEVSGGAEPYTYLWSDGRTNATNNAVFAGIHTVVITDAAGCSISQEVVIHQEEDLSAQEGILLFETHPNPATDQVRLQAEFDAPTHMRITITSLGGNVVFSEELKTDIYNTNVDVSDFGPGIYKVTIYTENNVVTSTLVVL